MVCVCRRVFIAFWWVWETIRPKARRTLMKVSELLILLCFCFCFSFFSFCLFFLFLLVFFLFRFSRFFLLFKERKDIKKQIIFLINLLFFLSSLFLLINLPYLPLPFSLDTKKKKKKKKNRDLAKGAQNCERQTT